MYRGRSRLLPIILIIVVIVVAIFAVVAVGRAFLGRNGQTAPVDDPVNRALLTTDADHSVRMIVRGPIIADEEFHSYRIEVSPIARRMTTYRGYQDQVIENKRFSNSTTAYSEFVHALARAEYTKSVELTEEQDDNRGICSDGRLYTFEILQAQSVVKTLWTSSCRNVQGSFRGDAPHIRSLFLKQIPESNMLLREINL